ncbi:MAG: hypothetical protein HC906_14880 [Bacteroidales bacterium]|nr:hypothetical protein [Bacteroidales bacterium]
MVDGKGIGICEKNEYTKYTSTLHEAWRMSINGLSRSLVSAAEIYGFSIPDFGPDDKFINDPVSQFGIVEAQNIVYGVFHLRCLWGL